MLALILLNAKMNKTGKKKINLHGVYILLVEKWNRKYSFKLQ